MLSENPYRVTWRKLFTTPRKAEWEEILTLIRLLFTIPISNAKLERLFSKLKRIKINLRCSLGNVRVENLLRSLEEYDVTPAIELWASSKSRRLHQNPRKQYAKHEKKRKIECLDSSSSSSEQESEGVDLELDECEDFIRS